MEDGVAELGRAGEELDCLIRVFVDEAFHLAENVEELRGWEGGDGRADDVRSRETVLDLHASREWWESRGSGIDSVWLRRRACVHGWHVEVCWRRSSVVVPILLVLILVVPVPSSIVIAVVHLQLPSHNLMAIQIPHSRCSGVGVGVFEEAKALGFASLFVVDEAEVDDLPDAAEDLADLLFADAWRGLSVWLMLGGGCSRSYRMGCYR